MLISTRILCLSLLLALVSCQSWQSAGDPTRRSSARRKPNPISAQLVELRRQSIEQEEPGNYFIGRRFHLPKTHFWGYVRRPGQSWDSSRLVIMSEAKMRLPDRLPEIPVDDDNGYGFDHNVEYRLEGKFSGRSIYDPNSNMVLPEFVPAKMEVRSRTPGWIFTPEDILDGSYLPRYEYGVIPGEP